jgi:hypothetical protein
MNNKTFFKEKAKALLLLFFSFFIIIKAKKTFQNGEFVSFYFYWSLIRTFFECVLFLCFIIVLKFKRREIGKKRKRE